MRWERLIPPTKREQFFSSRTFFVNNDDVTSRKLYGVDIRFHNMRTRQKERGILCLRLLCAWVIFPMLEYILKFPKASMIKWIQQRSSELPCKYIYIVVIRNEHLVLNPVSDAAAFMLGKSLRRLLMSCGWFIFKAQ